ncbi:MAG: hypothetical protein PHR77_09085 [Kiritimatiellae bacterium]|nr:hypothetical protein [Kiritimatiellia bacterium]MDD5519369.1 hypothetical protein [Kiritimatiellia bacterium]
MSLIKVPDSMSLFLACWFVAFTVETIYSAEAPDPFAGISAATGKVSTAADENAFSRFTHDNFTFKKEIFSQFAWSDEAPSSSNIYSRQSIGFEILKKFSTRTSTYAAFDLQMRLVRRDHFLPVVNDMEGADRDGFYTEYHNVYADFYNILNPLMSDKTRGDNAGRFNLRVGRSYVPFGINLQTDTHGTLLQLSNEENFGFERDWGAGLWGSLTPDLDYNVSYLLGSGYDMSFDGQHGLAVTRLSLAGKYLNNYGLEGGLSFMTGERLMKSTAIKHTGNKPRREDTDTVDTIREGVDGRYTHIVPGGTMSLTAELSTGQDDDDDIFGQLYQADFLNHSRKWGLASQYRRFSRDTENDLADESLFGEFTWYFRNDVGNTTLHWVKLNIEKQLEQQEGQNDVIVSVQYYRYW